MTATWSDGVYLEIDYDSLGHQEDYAIILSFSQIFGQVIERHRLTVSWRDVYLSHYDPTILAVCVVYDQALWLAEGIKRIIGVDRCTSNYSSGDNELIEVFDLPRLIRVR